MYIYATGCENIKQFGELINVWWRILHGYPNFTLAQTPFTYLHDCIWQPYTMLRLLYNFTFGKTSIIKSNNSLQSCWQATFFKYINIHTIGLCNHMTTILMTGPVLMDLNISTPSSYTELGALPLVHGVLFFFEVI